MGGNHGVLVKGDAYLYYRGTETIYLHHNKDKIETLLHFEFMLVGFL